MSPDDVDYAVPAAVESSRRRVRGAAAPSALWGGRGRRALVVGCWALAALLGLVVLVPLLAPDETGADSPEAAVEQLLRGIADVDAVAILSVVDPDEVDDPERARAAYDRLAGRVERQGEVPPADVTAVLAAAEAQVGGSAGLDAVALLAAVDLALDDLELRTEADPAGTRVHLEDGVLDVDLDPARLPDSAAGLGRASYSMPLAEGWVDLGVTDGLSLGFDPFLVCVERDGRWYVSLTATGESLFGPPRG